MAKVDTRGWSKEQLQALKQLEKNTKDVLSQAEQNMAVEKLNNVYEIKKKLQEVLDEFIEKDTDNRLPAKIDLLKVVSLPDEKPKNAKLYMKRNFGSVTAKRKTKKKVAKKTTPKKTTPKKKTTTK